jgi:uncharacterized protein YpuA (DUF1002 family)
MKKNILMLVSLIMLLIVLPKATFADAAPGDVIVTLGENLSEEQQNSVLEEMGVSKDIPVIYVSNKEEHQYLGNYISKAQIGTRAISSTKITILENGEGLNVKTNNINWVTEEMYTNALITAGVKDAEIYITAPFDVSGTAGLTGILKAYEVTAGIEIPEEQKQVANEEMVRTAELGERVGVDKASELITRIKEELGKNPVTNEEDLRALIEGIAKDIGITLTGEELDQLISLFQKMQDLNIDWDQVQNQLENAKNNLTEFLNQEETKSFIRAVIDFFISILDGIKSLFK